MRKRSFYIAIVVIASLTALICGWCYHKSRAPGRFGQSLEIRLVAIDSGKLKDIEADELPVGEDVLSSAKARRLSDGSETLPGWVWMPLIDSFRKDDPVGPFVRRNAVGRF